ncbi:uncharacterized protein LTR77_006085 [Saxophila tyrrhenica]|uniref:ASST-domain-containing protein n=1 Tax=Saxophila tyrrhenica TaxID=1690608 RepID=A0AAV9P749_9PEZI|nr:hypothetical protein LTR77_006085 [Saxophila tyrrhenica]
MFRCLPPTQTVRQRFNNSFVVIFFICFSFCRALSQSGGREELSTRSAVNKRYYKHKVVLDESRHDEEFFTFVTRPDLYAPRWNIVTYDKKAITPGYWFIAPYEEAVQFDSSPPWNAPHIYDSSGELVWSGAPVFNGYSTFDFRVIDVLGTPMLSIIAPHEGKAFLFDSTYQLQHEIFLGPESLRMDEVSLNVHEFATVDDGTRALHLTREPRKTSRENSKAVGYDGECYAGFDGFRELDVETWETVFSWTSEGKIGLDESVVDQEPVEKRCSERGRPWEYVHLNSIDKFSSGDYLLSGRRTNTIYKISGKDGSILWRFGGRKSDFQTPFKFSGQHAARVQSHNDTHTMITMLDNAFGPGVPRTTHNSSRGLIVTLDTTAMTAELITEYPHPNRGYATSRGNMQVLPNGHAWLCWTSHALESEYTTDGSLIMTAGLRPKIDSYRSWKLPWVGRPHYPPDVRGAVVAKDDSFYTIVHMSWNGATDIKEWRVYHTNEDGKNRTLAATVAKFGFETVVWTEGPASHVLAAAISKDGHILGESYIFPTIPVAKELGAAPTDVPTAEDRSWMEATARDPFVPFLAGIALPVLAMLAVYASRAFTRSRRRILKPWWKTVYAPLSTSDKQENDMEDQHENIELGVDDARGPLLGGKPR